MKINKILNKFLALNLLLSIIPTICVNSHAVNVSEYFTAEEAVLIAEENKHPSNIEYAREEVNKLPEGTLKEELNNRLNNIVPLMTDYDTANLDVYVSSKSSLSMTLDTNTIAFEGFSSVEDIEKENALNIAVKSSLPYELNAYLLSEFKDIEEDKTLDKSILNIRVNGEIDYNTFTDIGTTPIQLLDNQPAGNSNVHGIDFMLDADTPYEDGTYKTVVKFEAKQK